MNKWRSWVMRVSSIDCWLDLAVDLWECLPSTDHGMHTHSKSMLLEVFSHLQKPQKPCTRDSVCIQGTGGVPLWHTGTVWIMSSCQNPFVASPKWKRHNDLQLSHSHNLFSYMHHIIHTLMLLHLSSNSDSSPCLLAHAFCLGPWARANLMQGVLHPLLSLFLCRAPHSLSLITFHYTSGDSVVQVRLLQLSRTNSISHSFCDWVSETLMHAPNLPSAKASPGQPGTLLARSHCSTRRQAPMS